MATRHLAKMISDLRKQRGWSKPHLADAAGLSTRTIQWLEKELPQKKPYYLLLLLLMWMFAPSISATFSMASERAIKPIQNC